MFAASMGLRLLWGTIATKVSVVVVVVVERSAKAVIH